MDRPRLQPGQTELAKPFADRAFMHVHRPSTGDFGLQVHAPPADHLVDRRIRTLDNQFVQLGLLVLGQKWLPAWAFARLQALDAGRIVAMHPVAKGLSIHAVESRRLAARATVQDQRQSEHTPDLCAVGASAGQRPKLRTRMIRSCDLDRRAHIVPPSCESPHRDIESEFRRAGNPPGESESSQVGMRMIVIASWRQGP